ncbi:MAG: hypothetical protein IKE69_02995 [Thermoguttaceae bacterium]|nr:hypothetical protein [Thermoguttaceae bacterium]
MSRLFMRSLEVLACLCGFVLVLTSSFVLLESFASAYSRNSRDNAQGCSDLPYIPKVVMGCSGTAWYVRERTCKGTSGLSDNKLPGGCDQDVKACDCVPMGNDPDPYDLESCECWPSR